MAAEPITIFIMAFAVSLFLISLVRVVLHLRMSSMAKKYEALVQKKMDILKKDINDRTAQLHDAMHVINHEYESLFKEAKSSQKKSLEALTKTMDNVRKKQADRHADAMEDILKKASDQASDADDTKESESP